MVILVTAILCMCSTANRQHHPQIDLGTSFLALLLSLALLDTFLFLYSSYLSVNSQLPVTLPPKTSLISPNAQHSVSIFTLPFLMAYLFFVAIILSSIRL